MENVDWNGRIESKSRSSRPLKFGKLEGPPVRYMYWKRQLETVKQLMDDRALPGICTSIFYGA